MDPQVKHARGMDSEYEEVGRRKPGLYC